MGTISTHNGVAEDNVASYNGATASTVTSRNAQTWVHFQGGAATGGSIATDGNYKVHTFTSGGTFTVQTVPSN